MIIFLNKNNIFVKKTYNNIDIIVHIDNVESDHVNLNIIFNNYV